VNLRYSSPTLIFLFFWGGEGGKGGWWWFRDCNLGPNSLRDPSGLSLRFLFLAIDFEISRWFCDAFLSFFLSFFRSFPFFYFSPFLLRLLFWRIYINTFFDFISSAETASESALLSASLIRFIPVNWVESSFETVQSICLSPPQRHHFNGRLNESIEIHSILIANSLAPITFSSPNIIQIRK